MTHRGELLKVKKIVMNFYNNKRILRQDWKQVKVFYCFKNFQVSVPYFGLDFHSTSFNIFNNKERDVNISFTHWSIFFDSATSTWASSLSVWFLHIELRVRYLLVFESISNFYFGLQLTALTIDYTRSRRSLYRESLVAT